MRLALCLSAALLALPVLPVLPAAPAEAAGPPQGAGGYDALVGLVAEFRQFREPERTESGIADYSDAAVAAKREGLERLYARLEDMAVAQWGRARQVDWQLARSMLDGYRFKLEVSRPWARDPGFYVDPLLRTTFTELPVAGAEREALETELARMPALLDAGRANLDAAAADYADLALFNLRKSDGVGHGHPYRAEPPAGVIGWYGDFLRRARDTQPALVPAIERARAAVIGFRDWLAAERPEMTAPAGVGREAFAWYIRHVKLMPYSVEDLLALGEREYERLRATLALERHRNRDLPALEPAASEAVYARRINEADADIRAFLRERDILTVPDDVGELDTNAPWIERRGGRNFWEEVQYRDPRPDHVHAVIPGHRFDFLLAKRSEHPIRADYWDGGRVEGWGTYLEEALMHAGLLDERPRTRELFLIFGVKRAVRVRADVMMQRNAMSVAEAVDYMMARTPFLDEDVARVDAEIYLRRPPGYGLSYMIGKLQIEALLADWAHQEGEAFTLKAFHDRFLAAGRIPVSLIRYEMTGRDDEIAALWDRPALP